MVANCETEMRQQECPNSSSTHFRKLKIGQKVLVRKAPPEFSEEELLGTTFGFGAASFAADKHTMGYRCHLCHESAW